MVSVSIVLLLSLLVIAVSIAVMRYGYREGYRDAPRLHAWVVTLEESGVDRDVSSMKKNLTDHGMASPIAFIGVDGRHLNDATKKRFAPELRDMPGVMGCYLSHLLIWQKASVLPDDDRVLVLEDDAVAVRTLKPSMTFTQFDVVYLGYGNDPMDGEIVAPGIRKAKSPLGTYAYILSPAGARKLVSSHRYLGAVDWEISRLISSGKIKAVLVEPVVVTTGGAPSVIESMGKR